MIDKNHGARPRQRGVVEALVTPDFDHRALFYADEDEYLAGVVPFLRRGIEDGQPALVAVSEPKIRLIGDELGEGAEGIEFVDMGALGRNPARIIPVWLDLVERSAAAGRTPRGIGEPVWPGRSEEELSECQIHESLLNLAFAEAAPWSLLCPYDTAELDDEVLEAARRTHPHVEDVESPSFEQVDPDRALEGELPEPASPSIHTAFSHAGDLGLLRRFVSECAADSALDDQRRNDLVLAVNEVATNTIRHGVGPGRLRIWSLQDGLICDVQDRGRIIEPLAGRRRPEPGRVDGRGLWVANQLCDLVQIRSGDAGTTVRLHMRASA
jgi:anti-sigma regulatory factor (Ser/Thr protein kinase)